MENKKQAAVLRYDISMDQAPVLVAKGENALAEDIINIAEKSGVPVMENKLLIPFLMKSSLLTEIPVELYKAVSIVFRKLMDIDQGRKKGNGEKI